MRELFRPRRVTPIGSVLAALLAPAAATLVALPLRSFGSITSTSLYLLAVVAAAALGGIQSGLGAAALSFLGLNFFFTPPLHTFRVAKVEDWVALLVFVAVASIVGLLLARALEERTRATRREQETRLLSYFSSRLLSGEPLERMLDDFAQALLEPFSLARCEIHVGTDEVSFDATAAQADAEPGLSRVVPIVVRNLPFGTLTVVRRESLERLSEPDVHLLEACAKQVALAVERARLDVRVREALVESETSQSRAALFSSVTHDLRTPLASIKAGVTSLLDQTATLDDGQRRELLTTMLEETDRLNRLVGNILDLARVRAGALVPLKEPTPIEEVIESVLHRMEPAMHGIRVRTVIRPDLPEVPMDPVQVDQVLTNLLENAVRFSPRGGEVVVSASLWHRSVQVRIVDQGPGIPQEDRKRSFEPFVRRADHDPRSGSGLGLAIARAIVLAHGGRIWIEGAPSGGTAVVFELPVSDAEPIKQEPAP
ncbi:MAG: ATP-binding protein [Actinomycetota bacterium]